MRKNEALTRIECALYYAREDAGYDGEHHKMWVIDQMVRALTGCQLVYKSAAGVDGQPYAYQCQGENDEYMRFTASIADWDKGTAP